MSFIFLLQIINVNYGYSSNYEMIHGEYCTLHVNYNNYKDEIQNNNPSWLDSMNTCNNSYNEYFKEQRNTKYIESLIKDIGKNSLPEIEVINTSTQTIADIVKDEIQTIEFNKLTIDTDWYTKPGGGNSQNTFESKCNITYDGGTCCSVNISKKSCCDFFTNMFNKIKSFILPKRKRVELKNLYDSEYLTAELKKNVDEIINDSKKQLEQFVKNYYTKIPNTLSEKEKQQ
ncbi:MAG: hypothetical protein IJ848_01325 [Alphaproteobacteria bacterium]|nr:hypothetical protein [Alphaproteobacteria bacterium]